MTGRGTRAGLAPEAPLSELRGVGPARAARLARLGLESVRDLLLLVPRRVVRQGAEVSVREAKGSVGRDVFVRGRLRRASLFRRGRRRSIVSTRLADGTGELKVLWFNQPWMRERVEEHVRGDADVELCGRVVATSSGPALAAPRIGSAADPLPPAGGALAVYPSTRGIGQDLLRGLVEQALERCEVGLSEPLSAERLASLGLPSLDAAVRALHRPDQEGDVAPARRRLALEALLSLQAALAEADARSSAARARALLRPGAPSGALERSWRARLSFVPTACQERALAEIRGDLARERPMRRLLQGDVGFGKTLVAVGAALMTVEAGGQVALMAPTALLAEQHFMALRPVFEGLGVRVALCTGALPAAERERARAACASGEARLAVGTHALVSAGMRFARLDLVVVDEQQRFGVAQKRALIAKGEGAHVLLMTATPIPRTLALTLYGDLETSVLDERPPGRGEVRTHVVALEKRAALLRFLGERLEQGERAFWIAPRIDAAEGGGASAEEAWASLSRGPLGRHGVELLHGRVGAEERARRIARFRGGRTRLLVATTIVEVGVDVPEATVMVIEGGERLGLAQLHQLRGRIGRGAGASFCLCLESAPGARERLRFLEETNDGFAIAEEDLRRRGIGDLIGLRQAGVNSEGLLGPDVDLELVRFARAAVREDPALRRIYLGAARASDWIA